MNTLILFALLVCMLIGFVFGAIIGIVIAHDEYAHEDDNVTIQTVYVPERCEDPNVWREDLDDPEG